PAGALALEISRINLFLAGGLIPPSHQLTAHLQRLQAQLDAVVANALVVSGRPGNPALAADLGNFMERVALNYRHTQLQNQANLSPEEAVELGLITPRIQALDQGKPGIRVAFPPTPAVPPDPVIVVAKQEDKKTE